jgi:tetratricopeptide (TPR) repeat protein
MTDWSSCPSAMELAAFAEGRLSGDERARVVAHLADCAWCREVAGDTMRFVDEAHPRPASAPQAPPAQGAIYWGRRAAWLAAAAAIVLSVCWAAWRFTRPASDQADVVLAELAVALPARSIEGRAHAAFAWGPPPAVTRGVVRPTLPLEAQEALVKLRRLATEHPSARTIAAVGVAELVTGSLDEAITSLEAAAAREDADASVFTSLSAAHLERWRGTREPADAVSALDAAQHALMRDEHTPLALFNHALAVEALGMREQAIERWQAYLAVDSSSPWADEARTHLARLEREPIADHGGTIPIPVVIPTSLSGAARACATTAAERLDQSRIAFDNSRLAEAEALAREAEDALRCAGLPTADAQAQQAWTIFFQGRARDAIPVANRLLRDPKLSTLARGRMEYIRGLDFIRQARYVEADAAYSRALEFATAAGDTEYEISLTMLRSEVARARTDRTATWAGLVPALQALPALGGRRRQLALGNAVRNGEVFGLLGAAAYFADVLVAHSLPAGDPVFSVSALLHASNSRRALGRAAEARVFLDRATALVPSIPDETLRRQYETQADISIAALLAPTQRDTAQAAYDRLISDSRPSEQLSRRARALLGRGRLHAAAGRREAAERDWTEAADLFEDPRPEVREEQWRVDSRNELWGIYREMIRVRHDDPLGSLEFAERSRGRALLDARARGVQSATLSGAALFDWLPHDVLALAYAVQDRELYRWTISRAGVTLDVLPIASASLTAQVDAFAAAVAAGRPTDARELARLLLPATLSPERTPRLVFLPDGALYRVPFAALPLSEPGRVLVDAFVAQSAPSLTMLKEAATAGRAPRQALLIASGDAQPHEKLAALPGTRVEVRSLASVYPSATVLMDSAATVPAVLAALPAADLVHFAGHVVTDAVVASRSRLLLSTTMEPSTLTFGDLRTAHVPRGATVVLSACDGARGRVFTGEGMVGLPFVFLAGGASSVVAALWPVDDAAPVTFWTEVHARLRSGVPPSQALAESQRRARQSGVPSSVWAAFTTIGGLVSHE